MTDNSSDVLNRVLARVYRSLLQYAVDCWPWSTATDTLAVEPAEQKSIESMVKGQQESVTRLADLITQRGDVADFGSFPDNSEMHYVSLDYLLGKLIADEQDLVADLQGALAELGHDAEAAALVSHVLAAETRNVARLRDLSQSLSAA